MGLAVVPGWPEGTLGRTVSDRVFILAVNADLTGSVEISDVFGKRVYAGHLTLNGASPLNVSALAPGFYTVLVVTNGIAENFKLIVNR